jgi:hypothetical protein
MFSKLAVGPVLGAMCQRLPIQVYDIDTHQVDPWNASCCGDTDCRPVGHYTVDDVN